jgi:hypothetical protein
MNIKYSGKKFEGYTHKFIIEVYEKSDIHGDRPMFTEIYSNDISYGYLRTFLTQKFEKTAYTYRIANRVGKANIEKTEHIINEILKINN